MRNHAFLFIVMLLVSVSAFGATSFLVPHNNASGVLEGDITNAGLSVVLEAGDGANFPAAFNYHISIDDEILVVTNRVTDTLTVTRGAEGTTPAAHYDGVAVYLNITAQAVSDLNTAVNALEAGTFTDGLIEVGADITTQGEIYLYGDAANDGGAIRLFNSANDDTTIDYWIINVEGTTLYIGSNLDPIELDISNGGDTGIDGDLTVRGGGVYGHTNASLTFGAQEDIILHVDTENDTANKVIIRSGAPADVAEFTEAGLLQLDDDILVDGGHVAMSADLDLIALTANTGVTINGALTTTGAEGASSVFTMNADEGDDDADQWRWIVSNRAAAETGVIGLSTYATGAWVQALQFVNSNATITGTLQVTSNTLISSTSTAISFVDSGGDATYNDVQIADELVLGGNQISEAGGTVVVNTGANRFYLNTATYFGASAGASGVFSGSAACGIITVTGTQVLLDPAEATAVLTIVATNSGEGDILIISLADAGFAVTFNEDGNLNLGANRVLDSIADRLVLQKDGTDFYELSYSDNS